MTQLTLYSRRACPLCDEMMLDLDMVLRGRDLTYRVVDIDSDPQLTERYGLRIPVLCLDGKELCSGHFDPACLANDD